MKGINKYLFLDLNSVSWYREEWNKYPHGDFDPKIEMICGMIN